MKKLFLFKPLRLVVCLLLCLVGGIGSVAQTITWGPSSLTPDDNCNIYWIGLTPTQDCVLKSIKLRLGSSSGTISAAYMAIAKTVSGGTGSNIMAYSTNATTSGTSQCDQDFTYNFRHVALTANTTYYMCFSSKNDQMSSTTQRIRLVKSTTYSPGVNWTANSTNKTYTNYSPVFLATAYTPKTLNSGWYAIKDNHTSNYLTATVSGTTKKSDESSTLTKWYITKGDAGTDGTIKYSLYTTVDNTSYYLCEGNNPVPVSSNSKNWTIVPNSDGTKWTISGHTDESTMGTKSTISWNSTNSWVCRQDVSNNSDEWVITPTHDVTLGSCTNGSIAFSPTATSPQTILDGSSVTVTATPADGYALDKWKVGDTEQSETKTSFTYTPTTDCTISATFKASTFTVTFNANGHGTAPDAQTITNGGKVTKPSDPSADGYRFDGWYKEMTCTNAWDFDNNVVNANTTLYAKWTQVWSVTLSVDGNKGGTAYFTDYPTLTTKEFAHQNSVSISATADTGYEFNGWWQTSGTSSWTKANPYSFNMNAKNDETTYNNYYKNIVAHFTAISYTISYDLAGGTVETTNPTSYTIESAAITLNNPTRKGYTFTGWTGTDLTEKTMTVTIPAGSTEARSYTANWEKESYTITYNLDGGTVETENPTSYDVETESFTLNNPTKTGCTFTGWTGTDLSDATETVTIAKGSIGNREYTANWKTITYTVTLNPTENGTLSANKTSVESGSSVIITATPNDGYELSTSTITMGGVEQQVSWYYNMCGIQKVTGDIEVSVTFSKIVTSFTITPSIGEGGTMEFSYTNTSLETKTVPLQNGVAKEIQKEAIYTSLPCYINITPESNKTIATFTVDGEDKKDMLTDKSGYYSYAATLTDASYAVTFKDIETEGVATMASTNLTDTELKALNNSKTLTSIDFTSATTEGTTATVSGLDMTNHPNCLVYVNDGTTVDDIDHNVVVKKGTDYTCSNFVITDGSEMIVPTAFTATTASYSRSMNEAAQWGTICLPYEPTVANNIAYYGLEGSSTSTSIRFSRVDYPQANTPYLYKRYNTNDFVAEGSNALVTVTPQTSKEKGTSVGKWQLVGVLKSTSVYDPSKYSGAKVGYSQGIADANSYYLGGSDNTIHQLNGRFNLKAFRAYLSYVGTESARPNTLSIDFEDTPTGVQFIESEDGKTVEMIYDLNGRKLQNAQKGINIINGKKVLR